MALFSSVLSIFKSFIPGPRLIDGQDLLEQANMLWGVTTGITALAGGGQAGATQLQVGLNRVDTATNTGDDSVMLPPAIVGARVVVYNNTAYAIQVFGQPANAGGGLVAGDTIAAHNSNTQQATGTGVSHPSAIEGTYDCYVLGQWKQSYSA